MAEYGGTRDNHPPLQVMYEDLRQRVAEGRGPVSSCHPDVERDADGFVALPNCRIDLYFGGFECYDNSVVNRHRQPILVSEREGGSLLTLRCMVGTIGSIQPRCWILENVGGCCPHTSPAACMQTLRTNMNHPLCFSRCPEKKTIEMLSEELPDYSIAAIKFNSLDTHASATSRTRTWFVGVLPAATRAPAGLPSGWEPLIHQLLRCPGDVGRRPVSVRDIMLKKDSPYISQEFATQLKRTKRMRPKEPALDELTTTPVWLRQHQGVREEWGKQGLAPVELPDRSLETLSSLAQHQHWGPLLAASQHDLVHLLEQQTMQNGTDPFASDLVWDISSPPTWPRPLSQHAAGTMPCLLRHHRLWVSSEQRFLIGPEHLFALGFPVLPGIHAIPVSGMRQMAGNGMAIPAIGVVLTCACWALSWGDAGGLEEDTFDNLEEREVLEDLPPPTVLNIRHIRMLMPKMSDGGTAYINRLPGVSLSVRTPRPPAAALGSKKKKRRLKRTLSAVSAASARQVPLLSACCSLPCSL